MNFRIARTIQRDQPGLEKRRVEDANLHRGQDDQNDRNQRIDLPSGMLGFVDGVGGVPVRAVTVFNSVIAHARLIVLIR
ncbi:MAG: hypothetical protein QOG61_2052 [Candidatus Binataceae bacterium]|nr:hypothetical protein [Candidatus Binataceae bacterium]